MPPKRLKNNEKTTVEIFIKRDNNNRICMAFCYSYSLHSLFKDQAALPLNIIQN